MLEAGIVGNWPRAELRLHHRPAPRQVSSDRYGGDSLQKSRDHITVQRRAVTFASELAAELGLDRDVLDPCGRYNLAVTPEGDKHLADYAAQLDRLGETRTMLDAPAVAGVTGSRAFTSGIYMPGTVIVQPAAYVRALADSLTPPVRLFEQTPAVSFQRKGDGWLVRTPKGSVESPRIVLANNGYAERFGFFRGRLLHVYTYASMTEPFEPVRLAGQRSWAATPASPIGTTLRRVAGADGDRLLVRSRYTYNPGLDVGEATLRRAGAVHDAKFAHRFPSLAGTRMQYRWGGAMALNSEQRPRLRRGRAWHPRRLRLQRPRRVERHGIGPRGSRDVARRGVGTHPDLPWLPQPAGVAAATSHPDRREGDARLPRLEGWCGMSTATGPLGARVLRR